MHDKVSYRLATLRLRSLIDPAYTDLDAPARPPGQRPRPPTGARHGAPVPIPPNGDDAA